MGRNNDPEEVRKLQGFLNAEMGSSIPITGFFGQLTDEAVRAFQSKYATEILGPWGINTPTGYVYLTTRKKINEIFCRPAQFPLTTSEVEIIARTRLGMETSTPPASGGSGGAGIGGKMSGSGSGSGSGGVIGTTSSPTSSATSPLTSPGAMGPVSNAQWWLLALLAVLVAAGVGWYYWSQPPQPPSQSSFS